MNRVETTVKQILGRLLGVELSRLKREAALVRDLGADSSHGVELMLELEDAFEVQIAGTERHDVVTVGDVIRLAEKLQLQQQALLDPAPPKPR